MTMQRIKGFENWYMECIITIPIRCPEEAIITESYKTDIIALQEIRWMGEGIIDKKNHTIFYSCDRKVICSEQVS
jgi:hypothetical protein